MILRHYQERLVEAVFEQWRRVGSTIIVAATGCGKTVIFAEIIRRSQPGRALVLAHRNELIMQAREKIEARGIQCEIEKAELYAQTNLFHATPVVVSSIQTQCSGKKDNRRYMRFKPTDFSLLICDEGHHAAAPSWREAIGYYRQNPKLKVLGVTATPDRADEEALSQVFESVAGTYGMLDAIMDGYLVIVTQQFVSVKSLDYSGIRTTAGDLNEGDLAKVLEAEKNAHQMCQATLEAIHGLPQRTLSQFAPMEWKAHLTGLGVKPRRTIVFTVSVLQAERYAEVLSRAMGGVEWVCGHTRKEDRAAILERFSRGETHAVVNCGVLTEGFDNPAVELIIMARPTKSRSLYAQMVGRSTRPLTGLVDGPELDSAEKRRAVIAASPKPYCRILDFVGNTGRHKLMTCMDILGGHVTNQAAVDAAIRKAQRDGKPVRVLKALTDAEVELEHQKREEAQRRRLAEAARRVRLLMGSDYTTREVNAFELKGDEPRLARVNRGERQFSERQYKLIRRLGKDPATLNYWQGTRLIQNAINRWNRR